MAFLISKLSKREEEELLHDLNYLNTTEIKSFCEQHSIPHTMADRAEGGR